MSCKNIKYIKIDNLTRSIFTPLEKGFEIYGHDQEGKWGFSFKCEKIDLVFFICDKDDALSFDKLIEQEVMSFLNSKEKNVLDLAGMVTVLAEEKDL